MESHFVPHLSFSSEVLICHWGANVWLSSVLHYKHLDVTLQTGQNRSLPPHLWTLHKYSLILTEKTFFISLNWGKCFWDMLISIMISNYLQYSTISVLGYLELIHWEMKIRCVWSHWLEKISVYSKLPLWINVSKSATMSIHIFNLSYLNVASVIKSKCGM